MVTSAVILAVGSPTHQTQLAYNRPRAMLPVLGKPLVLRTMELLYRAGIRRYLVVVGEDEGAVAGYLTTQWLPNVQVEFAYQPGLTSLARTLANVARQLAEPFVLAGYNAFVQPNFPERLLKHQDDLGDGLILSGSTLTLSRYTSGYVATIDGLRVREIAQMPTAERPPDSLLLANLALCGTGFVSYLADFTVNTSAFSKQFLDIARLYLQSGGQTAVAETAWSLPIETDEDLLTLNKYLLDGDQETYILSELPGSVQIIPPVRVDPNVSVGQGARLGPRVYLEAGCSIGAYASISDAVILQQAVVPARQHVSNAIISTRVRINDSQNLSNLRNA